MLINHIKYRILTPCGITLSDLRNRNVSLIQYCNQRVHAQNFAINSGIYIIRIEIRNQMAIGIEIRNPMAIRSKKVKRIVGYS